MCDKHARSCRVVDAVRRLRDGDPGFDAEVVVVVFCVDWRWSSGGAVGVSDLWWCAGDGRVVLVLALGCDTGGFEDPCFIDTEESVAVRVAGDECSGEVVGGVGGCSVVIGNADVGKRHVAGVCDRVGPRDGVSGRDEHARCRNVVDTVRRFRDVDGRVDAEVVGRIRIAIFVLENVGCVHLGGVEIGPGDGDLAGVFVRPSLVNVE